MTSLIRVIPMTTNTLPTIHAFTEPFFESSLPLCFPVSSSELTGHLDLIRIEFGTSLLHLLGRSRFVHPIPEPRSLALSGDLMI
jgi:hypothetical protein